MIAVWYVSTLCMVTLRCVWLVVALHASLSLPLVVFAIGELLAVLFGVVNAVRSRHKDMRIEGLLIPMLYVVPLFLTVERSGGHAVVAVPMVVVLVLEVITLLYLRSSFTAGPSSFVKLRSSGPYVLVRHPLLALMVAQRVLLVLAYPSAANAGVLLCFVACVVGVVLVEERYLRQIPEWRGYSANVRWRLVPFVF